MSLSKRKKRKKQKGPRRKRMTREARLSCAKDTGWIDKYEGKRIVKGYRKWFGVDSLCAIVELRLLGVAISDDYETSVRNSIPSAAEARKKRRTEKKRDEFEEYPDSDETFAFIAGYTPAGLPYGTTWEELEDGGSESYNED